MANTNITLENLLELAQAATSIGDGDYIFIYKAGANGFSKIEKNVFFQGIAASAGGGMSDEVYAAIQNNVEALRSILYALTKTWLANLAFTNGRPSDTLLASIASQFTWPANEGGSSGGDTPTGNPSLTVYVDGVAVANGGTINVGTNTGNGVSKTITIKGSNLTSAVSLSMGASTSGLSVSPTSIDASQVMASSGATATISYSGTIASASGSLTISSGTASVTLGLTASYQEQGGGDEPTPSEITFTKPTIKRGVNISKNSSGGTITLESKSNLAATTDWIALSGNWHKIVLYHNVANNVDGYSVMLLCKFKDLGNGTTGVMPGNYGNMGNTNNSGVNGPYVVDMSNRTVSLNRLVDKICTGYSGTGSYEITHIAFSVANNPNIEEDSENWGQYPYNNNTFTPGAANAKIYASEDDANPQVIFSADDPNSYNITNE